ncbi:hypothetical protein GQX74_007993 [Glossina fuscipes]|nr:hypothetical protein GQX74_007993 [Glossina fuscipes]
MFCSTLTQAQVFHCAHVLYGGGGGDGGGGVAAAAATAPKEDSIEKVKCQKKYEQKNNSRHKTKEIDKKRGELLCFPFQAALLLRSLTFSFLFVNTLHFIIVSKSYFTMSRHANVKDMCLNQLP